MDLGLGQKPGLARCPKCAELIDAASRTCRYCSSELDPAELQLAAEEHRLQTQETARRNNRRALIAGIGSLVFTVTIAGLWFGGKLWLNDKVFEMKRNDEIEELLRQKNIDRAILLTTEYLKSNPEDAELHLLLGRRSLVLKQDRETAQTEFEKVMQLDPANASAPFLVGLLLFEKKQYQEADASFTKGIELGLKNVEGFKFRGVSRAMTSKTELAIEDFKAAEGLDAKKFRVDCGLGMVDVLKNDRDSAIKHLGLCVEQSPTDPVYLNLFGAQMLAKKAAERPH